jgi:tocopherol cyclase
VSLSSAHRTAVEVVGRLASGYRHTGADLPGGDPVPSHGTEMEGWFWRFTDPASGRVVVALCGVNRHRDGDWATVAVALHPGGVVRSAALGAAVARQDRLQIQAGGTDGKGWIEASRHHLRIRLDDVNVDVRFDGTFDWPKRTGGGGVFSMVPFLNQYWHPYWMDGRVSGEVVHAVETWRFADAKLYAERNWGAGFPDSWWWGQAHDFTGEDLSVVFTGGMLRLGPLRRSVGGVVLRLRDRVIRVTPPNIVRTRLDVDRWSIRARSPRYRIDLEGSGAGTEPHVLPVPLPSQRRNVETDFEHLAGTLRCVVRSADQMIVDATSTLAGLELGCLPGIEPLVGWRRPPPVPGRGRRS